MNRKIIFTIIFNSLENVQIYAQKKNEIEEEEEVK